MSFRGMLWWETTYRGPLSSGGEPGSILTWRRSSTDARDLSTPLCLVNVPEIFLVVAIVVYSQFHRVARPTANSLSIMYDIHVLSEYYRPFSGGVASRFATAICCHGNTNFIWQFLWSKWLKSQIWKLSALLFSAAVIPYSRKIQQGIKFGGLAVRVETPKLKFANTILHVMHNDVMHAIT